MVRIEFLGPIRKEALEVDIDSLESLSNLLKEDESLQLWLENSAVAINDVVVKDKSIKLNDGDRVTLLPPVCGG